VIRSISSNQASFHRVAFQPGFNLVIADCTQQSHERDSRNGLGKTLLLEILHFCLGADATIGKGLCRPELAGWTFTVELDLGGHPVTVTRLIDAPKRVYFPEANGHLPVRPERQRGEDQFSMSIAEWNAVLGVLSFGLPLDGTSSYAPSFRGLFSYFARRSKGSILSPFTHHEKQAEWDKQVQTSFLLGLSWEIASQLQGLKDQKKNLTDFKRVVKTGIVRGYQGGQGDLEAKRVQIEAEATRTANDLTQFRVHERYRDIELEANRLTEEIHKVSNENFGKRRSLTTYERSLAEEAPPNAGEVLALYEEAQIALPEAVRRRVEEVDAFHRTVVANRQQFLAAECERLRGEITANERRIQTLTEERAGHLNILKTHRALEEYTRLQEKLVDLRTQVQDIKHVIENLQKLKQGEGEIRLQSAQLEQRGRRDYEEREQIRDRAINLFNENSQFLYEAPGKLLIDYREAGFKFDVEIERADSDGIAQMKIFCFDLMLAQIWADKSPSPKFLFHDSRLFDGVDERQRAKALILAEREARTRGFQYICTLNSDSVPTIQLGDFNLEQFIRLRLTDHDPSGCLLGIRF
jgi:uncharacterized protein YydD (DUF2326 family)